MPTRKNPTSSITVPSEAAASLRSRTAELELRRTQFLRMLIRNDTIAPNPELADVLDRLAPSKFAHVKISVSFARVGPKTRRRMRAAGMDFSSYVAALILADAQSGQRDFLILATR